MNVFARELTAEKIVFGDVQKLNSLGSVKVFLNVLLTVHLAYWRFGNDMVSIVESIMLNIMAKGSDNQRKSVLVIELGILDQSLSFEDKVYVLSNI